MSLSGPKGHRSDASSRPHGVRCRKDPPLKGPREPYVGMPGKSKAPSGGVTPRTDTKGESTPAWRAHILLAALIVIKGAACNPGSAAVQGPRHEQFTGSPADRG